MRIKPILAIVLMATGLLAAEKVQIWNSTDLTWTLCHLLAGGQEDPGRRIPLEPQKGYELDLPANDPVYFTLLDHLQEKDSTFRLRLQPAGLEFVAMELNEQVRRLQPPFTWAQESRLLTITGEQCRLHLLRTLEAHNLKMRKLAEARDWRGAAPGPARRSLPFNGGAPLTFPSGAFDPCATPPPPSCATPVVAIKPVRVD